MDKVNPHEIRSYSDPAEQAFDYSRVEPLIGIGSAFHEGHDEVSESDIRHWCEVMQDANPLYTDEEYARQGTYGTIIAPPTMVQTWSLDPMKEALERFVDGKPPFAEDPHNQIFGIIDEMGYHGVVATAQTQEYLKPVRPGDTLRCQIAVGGVSKYDHYTRMGVGRYVDLMYTFINQDGEQVCVAAFRVLKYRPPLETRRLYAG
jgi:acyl dehydratase